jgi:hypothetical protein
VDRLAFAKISSGFLHKCPGLAGHLAARQSETHDWELSTGAARTYLGVRGGQTATSRCVVQLGCLESATQMVRPFDRISVLRIFDFFVSCDYFLRDEAQLAKYASNSKQSDRNTLRSTVGRDSLESLCFEEAPKSLFATAIGADNWSVLGGVAYPVMAGDAELSDSHAIADRWHQSCLLVFHLCLPV